MVQFFILPFFVVFIFSPFAVLDFKLDVLYAFVTYVANRTSKEKEARFPNANALLGPRPQLTNF